MSETRRTVSVEIVYDGMDCDYKCPCLRDEGNSYNVDWLCARLNTPLSTNEYGKPQRCDECKAEDHNLVYPVVDMPPIGQFESEPMKASAISVGPIFIAGVPRDRRDECKAEDATYAQRPANIPPLASFTAEQIEAMRVETEKATAELVGVIPSPFEVRHYRQVLELENLERTFPGHERPYVAGKNLSPGEPPTE